MPSSLLRLGDRGEPLVGTGPVYLPPGPPPASGPLHTLLLCVLAGLRIQHKGTVWTNVPLPGLPFERLKFRLLPIGGSFSDDCHLTVEIHAPGAYAYYVLYTDDEEQKTTRKFYFVVQPLLRINGEYLPLNSVLLQLVVSKWVPDWELVFAEVARKGYNMVHFTPLQQRGSSNLPYSIYDQLTYDPALFLLAADVAALVAGLEKNHGVLSMTDVVWNHTADNSAWLRDHPDAGYLQQTAPHLEAAIKLDAKLREFSDAMATLGYPTELRLTDDVLAAMEGIKEHVLQPLRLWEYYTVDVDSTLAAATAAFSCVRPAELPAGLHSPQQLAEYVVTHGGSHEGYTFGGLSGRFANKINPEVLALVVLAVAGEDSSLTRRILDEINVPRYASYDNDKLLVLDQLFNRIKYLRIDPHGPLQGPITPESPLTEPYFTRFTADGVEHALANNGWIWGGNPMVDFALEHLRAYLRREVVVWGDCVKLRYGSGPKDLPAVWERMVEYTQSCARTFHGFRIDNAHLTPIHVAEQLLDAARAVNPDLYVVAELFTGSEEADTLFVERLALSLLIREAMQAWGVEELLRLVHRHGGRPIGSLRMLDESPRPLTAQPVHALFMDCTHDNETPYQKRTVEDTLPNAALVAVCASAIGSVFGYDECYPELLDVVGESRKYTFGHGIGDVKKQLLEARAELSRLSPGLPEDHEMYLHHDGEYITVHRTHSRTGRGLFLVTRSKFSNDTPLQWLPPQDVAGAELTPVFAYKLERVGDPETNKDTITGVPVRVVELETPKLELTPDGTSVTLPADFPPGSIALFASQMQGVDENLDSYVSQGAEEAAANLSLDHINAWLYRAESEERDSSHGADGVYAIPNCGPLMYAGLQGFALTFHQAIANNDLAHPAVEHVRNGTWMMDYIVGRVGKYNVPPELPEWLTLRFDAVRRVPFFLRPRYLSLVLMTAYRAICRAALKQFPNTITDGTGFLQQLALVLVQMVGSLPLASLEPFAMTPCMAAGLPHFSTNYMRCWGRDVFISLRGLLLVTGRHAEAAHHITSFGATLKHGLIPNLLDSGRNPRYNARDAAWFWLQSVQDYVTEVPGGHALLDTEVKRRFPKDDTYVPVDDPRAFAELLTVRELVYEILARHAAGISYREANAGPNLDSQMRDEGFNVKVEVDWATGLVHGGSPWNCGTWMDKMGESERAGLKGVPGTPRDGANVEIAGLLKLALRWVNLSEGFPTEVVTQHGDTITLVEWEKRIQASFEREFFVPSDAGDDSLFNVVPGLVNRRGIYKDVVGTSKPYEDYQLRPNFPIAMTVAPELFTVERAVEALTVADAAIRGPVGMCTLDPSDLNYRPYYNNGEDSDDFATLKGRNYHQGPEWVWCMGYFLRAFAAFHRKLGRCEEWIWQQVGQRMAGHVKWLNESPWAGLTELTNKDGDLCNDSSPTQAWSSSCLLDVYWDMAKVE